MRSPLLFLVACAWLLGSCATMSEQECRSADWHHVGYTDGLRGHARSRIGDHAESCQKADVRVDEARYFAGREEGIRQYCRPDNALKLGLAGSGYGDVCPPALAPAFIERYRAGREVYDQRRRVDALDTRRRDLEARLSRATTDEERRRLRDDLRNLDFEMRRERDFLFNLEQRLRVERSSL